MPVCVYADVLKQLSLKQASCNESTMRNVAVRALSVPNTAGAGVRTWSTYSFLVNRNRNSLKPECAKKLVFAHYDTRLIRKIKRVDYESDVFKWDDGEGEPELLGYRNAEKAPFL